MADDEHASEPTPPAGNERPRTPLWVKVSGVVGLGAMVAFVVLHLTGYGMVGH